MRTPRPITLLFLALAVISSSRLRAQTNEGNFGVGIFAGAAVPFTAIDEHKQYPLGRTFIRYYPSKLVALELGLGIGRLSADDGKSYFTTPIYPVDGRVVVHLLKNPKFQPYVFGGIGVMYFNPVDQLDNALPRNANGEYQHFTSEVPIGGGLQFAISDMTALGIQVTYHQLMTDNLSDIKGSSNDSFWSIGLNLIGFLKPLNPDLDGDGLLNDEEKALGTDMYNPDTDGDGLSDGDEVHKYHTNPLKKDTDGDGLSDYDEIFVYHTDPLKADTDGDGLSDGDEVLKYHTDPLKADTDGDGLTDGDEVLKYHTDPLRPDTDGDGLTDGDEVLKYHTDPLKPDTDGGGMPDGKEIQLGLNPLDPSDDIPIINVGERIILEGVNFETNKTILLPSALNILDQVASSLAMYPTAEVAIHGHTDNVGGAKYNMKLSLGRAEAVKAYLVKKGIAASRITTKGFGFTKPVADNSTPQGRAKNRRIEFIRLR